MLNYLYAILEAETRIVAFAMGLDPALGVIHADRPHRDSLACDARVCRPVGAKSRPSRMRRRTRCFPT